MRKLTVFLAIALLQGCYSYTGPYVTKIESDGPGTLSVEKCRIKFNVWTGHFEQEGCATEKVKVDR